MDSLVNYGSDDESGEFNDSSKVIGLLIVSICDTESDV